jgi:hypothetical protein
MEFLGKGGERTGRRARRAGRARWEMGAVRTVFNRSEIRVPEEGRDACYHRLIHQSFV